MKTNSFILGTSFSIPSKKLKLFFLIYSIISSNEGRSFGFIDQQGRIRSLDMVFIFVGISANLTRTVSAKLIVGRGPFVNIMKTTTPKEYTSTFSLK